MNRSFFIAWVVIFVLWMAGSFVVHHVLLHEQYAKFPNLFRPEAQAQQNFWLMVLAHVFMAGAFTWIYLRGAEAKPWLGQGLRYGIAVAFLTIVPSYMIHYVVQPLTADVACRQIAFDGVLLLILGAAVAFLTRGPQRA